MIRKLFFTLLLVSLFVCSFFISKRISAQYETVSLGTPECNSFTDSGGTVCKEIKCKLSPGESPSEYDSCDQNTLSAFLCKKKLVQ